MKSRMEEEKSLAKTPTWAVATVVSLLVAIGFLLHAGLTKSAKWLDRTKRKNLLAALDKIKEELMVFGVLSLLMGHWIKYVAELCVKSSAMSSRFYPCVPPDDPRHRGFGNFADISITQSNVSIPRGLLERHHEFCPKGHQSFVSHESLEQLHRFLFVLGVTHVSYSVLAIVLAMIKIYSWRTWENDAKTMAFRGLLTAETSTDSEAGAPTAVPLRRLLRFMVHHVSHPWSRHKVLVWLLGFSRQFWSSINHADYMALRLGFITTHQLPFTYDFHNYMIRSMEEEFRDIVGISIPLWIFAICWIILGFHGTNIYFWLSFLPVILIFLVGTKLHHVVVKLAVEIMESSQWTGLHQFKLRDELFWFGSPRLLLRLIQFISFQNAFEMAMYVWSLWEIEDPSCFTKDRRFIVIRLTSGIVSQFWCSFITFPLYVIVTQMGSKFKKTIVSENVRSSLHGWRKKVKARHGGPTSPLLPNIASVDSMVELEEQSISNTTNIQEPSSLSQNYATSDENGQGHHQDTDTAQGEVQLRDLLNWPRESHHEEIETQDD